jgi:prepilin-type N-terminal cleavage/methylation domain-containing protein
MRPSPSPDPSARAERGATLIEIMMALVILAIGLLAVNQLFPAGSRAQTRDRLTASASNYVQQKIEQVSTYAWADTGLALGRHPPGLITEGLGDFGTIRRYYTVDTMPIPLDNLRKVTVDAYWLSLGDTMRVRSTTFVRR